MTTRPIAVASALAVTAALAAGCGASHPAAPAPTTTPTSAPVTVTTTAPQSVMTTETTPPPAPLGIRPASVTFVSADRGWVVGTTSGGTTARVEETTDGGAHWTPLAASPPGDPAGIRFATAEIGYAYDMPATAGGIDVTTDGGRSWARATVAAPGADEAQVSGLEIGGGSVWALVGLPSPWVDRAAVGSTTFAKAGLAGNRGAVLTVAGGEAYVVGQQGAGPIAADLEVVTTAGTSSRDMPCAGIMSGEEAADSDGVAAQPTSGDLVMDCYAESTSGSAVGTLFRSTDDGRQWSGLTGNDDCHGLPAATSAAVFLACAGPGTGGAARAAPQRHRHPGAGRTARRLRGLHQRQRRSRPVHRGDGGRRCAAVAVPHPRRRRPLDQGEHLGQLLRPDHVEQPEPLGRHRPGRGRVRDDPQVAARRGQLVAVEVDRADLRVVDPLAGEQDRLAAGREPVLPEGRARVEQIRDQSLQAGVAGVAQRGLAQLPDLARLEVGAADRGLLRSDVLEHEVPPEHVAVALAAAGGIADERRPQRVPQPQRERGVEDADRRADELVDEPLHARGHVGRQLARPRGRAPGEGVQPGPVGVREPQRPGQRGEHLRRRRVRPALLEPGDVVDRDPGQLRELLAAQPGRPPGAAAGQAHVLGTYAGAPPPQRLAEPVHPPTVGAADRSRPRQTGNGCPRKTVAWMVPQAAGRLVS